MAIEQEIKKNSPLHKEFENLLDKRRKNSPLLKHRDAIEIDTGKLNKQTMLIKMTRYIESALNKKYGI